jgi:hypothetical protein
MQILKETGIDWHKIFSSKLYVDQSVNVRLDQREIISMKIGR